MTLKIMVLDGDYAHALAVQAELKYAFGATILSVATSTKSASHRSRYTDIALTAPRASSEEYPSRLIQLAREHRPDIIVPIGHAAFNQVNLLTDKLPRGCRRLCHPSQLFGIASDKQTTYELARNLDIRVPIQYRLSEISNREAQPEMLFPIFAKARYEQGGVSTAFIRSHDELNQFDPASLGGEVILQEYIGGDPYTYAHNAYFDSGKPILSYQHVELRSVPRRGGSGTRVRLIDDPQLAQLGNRLMGGLRWNGVAQIEFKRSTNGELVLMEINPKFWATYALAPASGHMIASVAVARALGMDTPRETHIPRAVSEMVFPVREAAHALRHWRSESLLGSAWAMLWPPAPGNVPLLDVRAHFPRLRRSKGIN